MRDNIDDNFDIVFPERINKGRTKRDLSTGSKVFDPLVSVRTINVLNLQLSIILQVSVISASKVMFWRLIFFRITVSVSLLHRRYLGCHIMRKASRDFPKEVRCARVRKKESLQPCCTQAPSQMLLQKYSRFNLPIRVTCLAYPVQCLVLSVIIRDFSNQICALQLPYLILLPLLRSTFECSFPWLKFFHISVKRY